MGVLSKESGTKIIWKEWVCILGRMGEFIRECIEMIKSMGMEFISGRMGAFMRDIGIGGSSMDSGFTTCRKKRRLSMGCGRMESGSSGSMNNKRKRLMKNDLITHSSLNRSIRSEWLIKTRI